MKKDTPLSRNLVAQLIYQLSLGLLPFICTPYLSRVLGSGMIGRFSYARSIASYFILAAGFGTATYGQRLIASLQADPKAQNRAFYDLVLLRMATACVGGAVYFAAVVPGSVDPAVSAFVGAEIFSVAVDISWYYQGCERFSVIAFSSGIVKSVLVVLLFIFVKRPSDVVVYAALYGGSTLVCGLMQWCFLPEKRSVREKAPLPLPRREWNHAKGALALFAAQLAIQVYTVLDKTMIGMITGLESENGYYDQAQRLIKLLEACCAVISPVIASRVAVLWSRKQQDEALALLKRSMQFACCIGVPMAMGLQLIVTDFVPIYYGPSYEPVVLLLRVLAFLPLIIGMSNVIGIQFLVPTGRERFLTASVTIGAAVNAGLNLILIRAFRSFGAALASVAAEIVVTAVQMYCVRREFRVSEVLKSVLRYALMCVPMLLCGVVLRAVLHHPGLRLVATIVVCCGVYLCCLILTKDPLLRFAADLRNAKSGREKR